MPNQIKTRYIVCTKNRGFQRKHIEVCKRCSGNDGCQEFQKYLRMEPLASTPNNPIQKADTMSIVDLMEQLTEIRKLVGGRTSGSQMHRQVDATYRSDTSLDQFLRAELKAIQLICQFNITDPKSYQLEHLSE